MQHMSESTHDEHPPVHEPDDAGHGHDGHDDHEEHGTALGPIDWFAWGAGLLGVGAGVVVAFCLSVSMAL
jgi:hypothetical protein